MRILLILIFLCSTANAALTPNKLPKTKTGGTAPTLQDSVIYDDGTNVGIGTTSPAANLQISGSANTVHLIVKSSASQSAPFNDVEFQSSSGVARLKFYDLNNSPRIMYDYSGSNGGDFTGQLNGVDQMSFGFNNAGSFGGSAGVESGRLIYFYDRVSDAYRGAINASGDFYWGTTTSAFSVKLTAPASESIPIVVRGSAGQTANLQEWQNSSGTVLSAFNPNGNVGIGTTAPVKRLDIKSSGTDDGIQVLSSTNSAIIQLIEQSTTAGRFLLGSSTTQSDCISSGDCNWKNSGDFIYSPSSTERFRVTSTGNVGIGTVNPISMLQVFKANNPATLSLTSNPASTTIINLGDTTQPTMGQVAYANASDSMYFVVNGAEMMRVSSTGNVGIGTNGLIRGKLHIYDNSHSWYQNLATWGYKYSNESNDRINISSSGSDPRYAYIGFNNGNVSLNQSGVVFAKRNTSGSVGVASIQTSDGSSLVERIVIDGAGNVGIATFSPTSLFEITSTVSRDLFRVNDNGNGDTSPFVIDSTGNVGIGTTNPIRGLQTDNIDVLIGSSVSNGNLIVGNRIGINSLSPSSRIDVFKTSDGAEISFPTLSQNTLTIGDAWYSSLKDGSTGNSLGKYGFIYSNTNRVDWAINSLYNSGFNSNELLRVTGGGNVGIGTSVPTAKLVVGNNGHILSQASSSPTLSSCGTSPSVTTGSTDSVGEITVGTGTITSCTLTFVTAFDRAPHCFIQGNTTSNKTYAVTNTTTTMVISSGSAFDTEVIDYLCIGN